MTTKSKKAYIQATNRATDLKGLDDYPTPKWATRALFAKVPVELCLLPNPGDTILEPCANRGYMSSVIREQFPECKILELDIHDYGNPNCQIMDFLKYNKPVDYIITNPPFNKAEEVITHACKIAKKGCAFLTRLAYLEGTGRYTRIYSKNPPKSINIFTSRVTFKEHLVSRQSDSMVAYIWAIWDFKKSVDYPKFNWIPSCQKELERFGDYNQIEYS